MEETYISIMIQSLRKKAAVLDEIIRQDDLQKDYLMDPECEVEKFDETVENKNRLIEQLTYLDSGFEKLYAQVAEELEGKKAEHATEIREMQSLIKNITDKSVMIQAQEARNKDLMMQKFGAIKKHARNVRVNSKAITGYYRTMNPANFMDPQFMEKKQ